jgi:hemolysin activation/secretion protein
VTQGLRGFGSDSWAEWDNKRYMATPNFFSFNAELTETYDLPGGLQLFGRLGGQLGDQPLVSSEQYSIGGLNTVRGYLESTALGDSGASATLELRSPDIGSLLQAELEKSGEAPKDRKVFNEWRLFAFLDAGFTKIHDQLVEQESSTKLSSFGVGTSFKAFDALNGMVAVAVPRSMDSYVNEGEPRVLFRIWGEL